jgi:hypothetical protein
MIVEHRGFIAVTDVVADKQGVQWVCSATFERADGNSVEGVPQGIEFSLSRAKIDPLMAASALEHRAIAMIDDWHMKKQN